MYIRSDLAADSAWAQWELRLEMAIEWTWRWTWRRWSREFGDALGGGDRVNFLEMHLEAVIEWTGRCTWKMVDLEAVDREGGRDRSWDSIHWLTCNCGNVTRVSLTFVVRETGGGRSGGGRSGGGRSGGGQSGGWRNGSWDWILELTRNHRGNAIKVDFTLVLLESWLEASFSGKLEIVRMQGDWLRVEDSRS
jgi:hypothetical protein